MKFFIIILMFGTTLILSSNSNSNEEPEYKWYKVISIIDGDTLRIKYHNKVEKVRLYGIDAPERNTKGYFKAAAALEKLCFNKQIRLIFPGKKRRDRFNRLLAIIYLKNGIMVNKKLYDQGVVKLYKRTPLF